MNAYLYGSVLIVILEFLMWRTAIPQRAGLRALFHWALFCGLSVLLFKAGLSPWQPESPGFYGSPRVFDLLLLAAWWLMAGRSASYVGRKLLVRPSWPKERLIQEVIGAALIIASGIVALTLVFGVPLRGLIATSGAAAIIIGLAVQNILHDVFSGIVISATEPYHPGDLIVIDDMQGRVIETNWHATHLLSTDRNLVVIPNSVAARSKIVNKSRPTTQHEIAVLLHVPSSYGSCDVADALLAGALQVSILCHAPSPYVTVKSSRYAWTVYEVVGFIDDIAGKHETIIRLYDACHKQLRAIGISVSRTGARAIDVNREALKQAVYFRELDDIRLNRIQSRCMLRSYQKGNTLLAGNDISHELFIVVSGVCTMKASHREESVQFARLGPSDTFGEAGVMAGMQGRFDVEALTRVSILAVGRDCIDELFSNEPQLARRMCRKLAERDDFLNAIGMHPGIDKRIDESLLTWLTERLHRITDHLP
jgi:small-conductance mechanosensitive channel